MISNVNLMILMCSIFSHLCLCIDTTRGIKILPVNILLSYNVLYLSVAMCNTEIINMY